MNNLLQRRLPTESLRFLVAGGFAALANWLVRFPLSTVLPFDAAVAVAYIIGMCIGFVLYRHWVFPRTTVSLSIQILRFIAVNLVGAVVVITVAPQFASLIANGGLSQPVSQALGHAAAIALGAVVNYFGHKLITFAAPAVLGE
jgi:putative flippase GtrA